MARKTVKKAKPVRQPTERIAPLTRKRQQFITEYLADFNGTQAAIRAGYSPRTANEQAARLLANASVNEAVSKGQEARRLRASVTADRVIAELACIAFGDVRALFGENGNLRPIGELKADVAAMLGTVEVEREKTTRGETTTTEESVVKVKSWDKVRALELLAKHLGLYAPEKVLHAGLVITSEQLAGSRDSLAEKLEGLRQRMLGEGQGVPILQAGQGVVNITAVPVLTSAGNSST